MTEETELTGKVYKAPSGQWSFMLKGNDGEEYCRGAGFYTEEEARQEMEVLLNEIIAA